MDDSPRQGATTLEPTEWRRWAPAVAAAAAFCAFLLQPVLRFAPAWALEIVAVGGAVSWLGLYIALMPGMHRGHLAFWGIVLFGFLCFLANTLDRAVHDAAANDKRCLAIQRDMLAAAPLKKDGPALFQALNCWPQGEGSVFVPARRANPLRHHLVVQPGVGR